MGWEWIGGGQQSNFLQTVHKGLGGSGLGVGTHRGDKRKREMGIMQVFRYF